MLNCYLLPLNGMLFIIYDMDFQQICHTIHFFRLSDLDTLQDFLQSASAELNWLNEKEQIEISRDWADPHINLTAIEEYYEVNIYYKLLYFVVENIFDNFIKNSCKFTSIHLAMAMRFDNINKSDLHKTSIQLFV